VKLFSIRRLHHFQQFCFFISIALEIKSCIFLIWVENGISCVFFSTLHVWFLYYNRNCKQNISLPLLLVLETIYVFLIPAWRVVPKILCTYVNHLFSLMSKICARSPKTLYFQIKYGIFKWKKIHSQSISTNKKGIRL
jgi:hypothetical protein